jgi:hypothetical protein
MSPDARGGRCTAHQGRAGGVRRSTALEHHPSSVGPRSRAAVEPRPPLPPS